MSKRRPSSSGQSPTRPVGDAGRRVEAQEEVTAGVTPGTDDRIGGSRVHLPAAVPWYRRPAWLGVLLFLVVAGVFLPALRNDFITYDDQAYVTGNARMQGGLTWENVQWAWRSFEVSNWHPLTWLSHMLDCQLFGLQPWGHHLTNVLLHAGSALVLFVVLRRATGAVWRSLIVAALFGLHPLRVESVAWIAERKDVLSALFWMLTLWAYVLWAQRAAAGDRRAWICYGLTFLALAVGLTAKPMLVTLPCVLLLLDVWPLNRWGGASWRGRWRLVAEKVPFVALAAVSCVLTIRAQRGGGAVKALDDYSALERVANALIAYGQYLGKLFWPTRLAVLYPNFGDQPPVAQTLLAGGVLLAVSAVAVLALRRGKEWFAVGWLWFLGTLVPVIGFVQVGGQTMADRYSYIPSVGLFVLVVWAVTDATERLPRRATIRGFAAAGAILVCGVLTSRQLTLWRNSVTLFRHTLAVTEDNWMAHYNLSLAYGKSPSTTAEAREEFRQMVAIIAAFAERHNRHGEELMQTPGHLLEAVAAFEKALRIKGDYAAAHRNRGRALAQLPGRLADAIDEYQKALRFQPDYPEVQYDLGQALVQIPERRTEAIAALRLAVWGRPGWAEAHCALAEAMASDPIRRASAIGEYEAALRLQPDLERARKGLEQLRAGER